MNGSNKLKSERDAASLEINHAVQGPGQGTLVGPKDLAGAAVAETMAAHQRDPGRRLAANESPQRCGSYGRLGAVGLPRVDFLPAGRTLDAGAWTVEQLTPLGLD